MEEITLLKTRTQGMTRAAAAADPPSERVATHPLHRALLSLANRPVFNPTAKRMRVFEREQESTHLHATERQL